MKYPNNFNMYKPISIKPKYKKITFSFLSILMMTQFIFNANSKKDELDLGDLLNEVKKVVKEIPEEDRKKIHSQIQDFLKNVKDGDIEKLGKEFKSKAKKISKSKMIGLGKTITIDAGIYSLFKNNKAEDLSKFGKLFVKKGAKLKLFKGKEINYKKSNVLILTDKYKNSNELNDIENLKNWLNEGGQLVLIKYFHKNNNSKFIDKISKQFNFNFISNPKKIDDIIVDKHKIFNNVKKVKSDQNFVILSKNSSIGLSLNANDKKNDLKKSLLAFDKVAKGSILIIDGSLLENNNLKIKGFDNFKLTTNIVNHILENK